MSTTPEVVARLASPEAGVRRLAIHDLVARSGSDPAVMPALLRHLPREPDEKAAGFIIAHAAAAGAREASPVLLAMYEDRRTPVRTAMAAIRAHDAMAQVGP